MTFDRVMMDPLVPVWLLAAAAGIVLLVVIYAFWRRAPGRWWRAGALIVACLLLLNPSLVAEDRTPLADHVLVVVDESPSNRIADREAQTKNALAALTRDLENLPNLTTHIVRVDSADLAADGTRVISAMQKALIDLPRDRLAGVLVVTDGQVHDAGSSGAALNVGAPIHTFLTGARGERDRRLVVETAPRFGIVGETVTLTVRVEDQEPNQNRSATGKTVPLSLQIDDSAPVLYSAEIGAPTRLSAKLTHGGPTIFDLRVDAIPNELTTVNNRVVLLTNGVRDRLRVLLISGEPHSGERTWRNLLKSDPSVDLVHFTILRPPEKQDGTPIRELSLIAFPTRELFQTKLHDFDLIIFDRYRRRGVLPDLYLNNVVDYVKGGGAILAAAGPAFASPLSLIRTPLESVLPSHPTGAILNQGFRPSLTDLGRRHPVTADLQGAETTPPSWGPWFRLIASRENSGNVLMRGLDERPLLVLDRVGEGRVAQLLSDHAWLWAKQYRGGGPQAELLRKLAHWLMREPDLEEEALQAIASGNQLRITRRSLSETPKDIEVISPTGKSQTVSPVADKGGAFVATIAIDEPGLYRIDDGELRTVAAAGDINPREFADLRATESILRDTVKASGGAQFWISEGIPTARQVYPERDAAGDGWYGLRQTGGYIVSGIDQYALLPSWLAVVLAVGLFMTAWYREGR